MTQYPLIPPEILALIQKPPLVKGESLQEYNSLLTGLVSDIAPADRIEWLWLLSFHDCVWEARRIRRVKAEAINVQEKLALQSVILKTTLDNRASSVAQAMQRWSEDPSQFAKHGVNPMSVPATATLQLKDGLEALDKMQERAERRCDTILQQLEFRRELFASRARRAAEIVLNAKHTELPRIEAAPLAIEDQRTPDQEHSEEAPIVPESPTEADTPSSEGASPEAPTSSTSSET